MSLFNNIEKISYTPSSGHELITLIEYIVFEDSGEEKKYIVFKFKNNIDQYLNEFRLYVKEYDETGFMIRKSLVYFKDLDVNVQEEFVPKTKFKISFRCKTISVELQYALFETLKFENGVSTYNGLSFDDYIAYQKKKVEEEDEKEEKAVEKQIRKEKKQALKNKKKALKEKVRKDKPFNYRRKYNISKKLNKKRVLLSEISRNNKTVSHFIIGGFITFALIGYTSWSVYDFRKNNQFVKVGDYVLKLNEDGSANIEKYHGSASEITIGEKIGSYSVHMISSSAFKDNQKITKLTVKGDVIIGELSFKNCDKLTNVYLEGNCEIKRFAFYDCDELLYVDASNSMVYEAAFAKSEKVSYFYFKDSDNHDHFGAVFGLTNQALANSYYFSSITKTETNVDFDSYFAGLENFKIIYG